MTASNKDFIGHTEKIIFIGEFTKNTNMKNGRCVAIGQTDNTVRIANYKDDKQVDGKMLIINTKEGLVFVGDYKTN